MIKVPFRDPEGADEMEDEMESGQTQRQTEFEELQSEIKRHISPLRTTQHGL